MSRDFLLEIGTEELPPKALKPLMDALVELITEALRNASLEHGGVRGFATPRRLALHITALPERQPDSAQERVGPAVSAAFNAAGEPSPAALGFARSCGVEVQQLTHVESDKGPRLAYRCTQPGQSALALLPDMVNAALKALPIPRRMRWGSGREEFVRPVHWVVMLFGEEVIAAEILGITAGRHSRGHRFHCNQPIAITAPANYVGLLRAGHVLVDFDERRALIRDGIESLAQGIGGQAVIDSALLDEVTALNEWPVPLLGNFESRFLEVPAQALVSSMKAHQKYFHIVGSNGALMPRFITVANIDSKDPARVISGNERVIRPRLSDAAFFFGVDKKTTLAAQRDKLREIVFQQKLGSLFDKTERVATLCAYLAPSFGAPESAARRAAELSKSDLVSAMVQEFADLQGIMGHQYALHDGEDASVAAALEEQYMPRFAGDELPPSPLGATLATADRLDTLTGIFAIGQVPSGSRDPFALRRASLGVLRILIEGRVDLDLRTALTVAATQYSAFAKDTALVDRVLKYVLERLRAWYEEQGIPVEVFQAVTARPLTNPLDIHLRVQAVHAFNQMSDAAALASTNKRVANILAKSDLATASMLADAIDPALLQDAAELALAQAVESCHRVISPLLEQRRYPEALTELASLRKPVDQFFDQVMVMAENAEVRNNRFALLKTLQNLFLNIADISLLVVDKGAA